ncbi:MAG: hypothetical protein NTX24_00175 [Candidatus Pacearchaeota archaeon]|nr:hypothetical protein [Candidatus Pacearchaeota archaeon]
MGKLFKLAQFRKYMSVRKAILKKLFKHRFVGGRHTELRNVVKGFPPNLIKDFKEEIRNLIREGFLTSKKSTGEIHISLNPRMLNEIRKEISEELN